MKNTITTNENMCFQLQKMWVKALFIKQISGLT